MFQTHALVIDLVVTQYKGVERQLNGFPVNMTLMKEEIEIHGRKRVSSWFNRYEIPQQPGALAIKSSISDAAVRSRSPVRVLTDGFDRTLHWLFS